MLRRIWEKIRKAFTHTEMLVWSHKVEAWVTISVSRVSECSQAVLRQELVKFEATIEDVKRVEPIKKELPPPEHSTLHYLQTRVLSDGEVLRNPVPKVSPHAAFLPSLHLHETENV
jgi:hypothetical protein